METNFNAKTFLINSNTFILTFDIKSKDRTILAVRIRKINKSTVATQIFHNNDHATLLLFIEFSLSHS